jgi:hypothetical protein
MTRNKRYIQVSVEVGLSEAVGMSVDELKQRMGSVPELQNEVDKLKTKSNESDKTMRDKVIELSSCIEKLSESIDFLRERYRDRENDEEVEEPDEEEPGIALEDQLRITEQSAKAIDLLSNHLLSTVWQTCSKNTFGKCRPDLNLVSNVLFTPLFAGFYIRIMLLCGSQFKKQLIPETASLIILGLLTVLFSAAMQIILAYYLWTRLPKTYPAVNGNDEVSRIYPGTSGGRSFFEWYAPPLPAYSYPNYKFANDVCRTVPIVQLVTIGLFLFSILNNIPGVIKNFHIIWNSDRFISVDEEGITKLHYWRESLYSRESANSFLDFIYRQFENILQNGFKKIEGELLKVHTSIESGTTGPWKDSDLSDLGRLRVRSHILETPSGTATNPVVNANSGSEAVLQQNTCCFSQPGKQGQAKVGLAPAAPEDKELQQNTCCFSQPGKQGQAKGGLAPAAPEDKDSRSAEVILGVSKHDVEAFVCEMYLSGSIIHDAKNQKLIRDYLKIQKRIQVTHAEDDKSEGDKAVDQKEHVSEYKAYAGAARRRWMLNECFTEILPKKWWMIYATCLSACANFLPSCFQSRPADDPIPKSFFEVCETRSFLAEALRLMDQANNTKKAGITKDLAPEREPMLFSMLRDNTEAWPPPIDVKIWPQPIQFCDQVRLNLVRIDYLRPSKWTRPYVWSWLNKYERLEDDREHKRLTKSLINLTNETDILAKVKSEAVERIAAAALNDDENKEMLAKLEGVFKKLEDECKIQERGLTKAINSLISDKKIREERKQIKCGFSLRKCLTGRCVSCCCKIKIPDGQNYSKRLNALQKFLGRDFSDVLTSVSLSHFCPSRMILFRFLAFTFGVLPELISLLFMVVAGVQYILWSGFKVGSDTQGMEEIILATLAINFIYEIDDAVYDHVLPELYKEAHERDRFDITGYWISAETSVILDKCAGTASSWWWHKIRKLCCCRKTKRTPTEVEADEEDCWKMLLRCPPIKCQTESSNPLERGFWRKENQKAEEKGVECKAEGKMEAEGIALKAPSQVSGILVFEHPAAERYGSSVGMEARPDQTVDVGTRLLPALAAEDLKLLHELQTRKFEGNATSEELKQLEELNNHDKPWLLLNAQEYKELEELKKQVTEELKQLVGERDRLADLKKRKLSKKVLTKEDRSELQRLEVLMSAEMQKKLNDYDEWRKRLEELQHLADLGLLKKAEQLVSRHAIYSDDQEHFLQQLLLRKFRGELPENELTKLTHLQEHLSRPCPVLSSSEIIRLQELLELRLNIKPAEHLQLSQVAVQQGPQGPAGQISLAGTQSLAVKAGAVNTRLQEKCARGNFTVELDPSILKRMRELEKSVFEGLHRKIRLQCNMRPSVVTWFGCKPDLRPNFASQWSVMNAHEREKLEELEVHLNNALSTAELEDLKELERRVWSKFQQLSTQEEVKKQAYLKNPEKFGRNQHKHSELLEEAEKGLTIDVFEKLMNTEKNDLLERTIKEILSVDEQNQMKKLQQRQKQCKMSWEVLSPDDKVRLGQLHQLAEAVVHRKVELLCQRPELSPNAQSLLRKSRKDLTSEDKKTLEGIKEQVKPWPVLNAWERRKLDELEGLSLLEGEQERLVQLKQSESGTEPLSANDLKEYEWLLYREKAMEGRQMLLKELQHLADAEVYKKVEQLKMRVLLGSELSAENQHILQLLLWMKDSGVILSNEEQVKLTRLQLLTKPWPVLNARERIKLQKLRANVGNEVNLLDALNVLVSCEDHKMIEQLRLRQQWMLDEKWKEIVRPWIRRVKLHVQQQESSQEEQWQPWRLNVQEHRRLRELEKKQEKKDLEQQKGAGLMPAANSAKASPTYVPADAWTDVEEELFVELRNMARQEIVLGHTEVERIHELQKKESLKVGFSDEMRIELELLPSRNIYKLKDAFDLHAGSEPKQQMKDIEPDADKQQVKIDESVTLRAKLFLEEETKDFDKWKKRFEATIQDKKGQLSNDWHDWDEPGNGGSPFVRAMRMSVTDEWNDFYLAHAYPFLYARKLRYAFANHFWERFLIFYGMWGMHLVVLVIVAIAIVGGYRTVAQCHRFAPKGDAWLGVFAKQVLALPAHMV